MVDQTYIKYLRSPEWQALRSQRLKIDNYKCQRCGRPFDLQVHHLFYPSVLGTEDPYRDLVTLCDVCHEIIEHQKKEYKENKKTTWQEKRDCTLRKIYRTIKQFACYDLSALGIGTKDYCNIDTIKADFGPILVNSDCDYGYVSRVQNYFRNQRYRIILDMIQNGYTSSEIRARTRFSWNMINKVYTNPEKAISILKNEKETEYYD